MEYDNQKINLSKNINVVLPLIIFSNLFPLYGVLKYNWTIFSVVYVYWFELLIITFFLFLKILFSKGDDSTFMSKFILALKLLILRCGIFLFYLLFIVVFLGFMASAKDETGKSGLNMFEVLFFRGSFFKITLISFFLYNLIDFLIHFIVNDTYKTSKPSEHFVFLDAHMLVVHIVVVLGTFLYKGVTEKLHFNHKSAMIACVALFVAVKIIADIIKHGLAEKKADEQFEKYI